MNGKSKGGEFERFVSKQLSLWISKRERDDLFWRTHNSGGRYTVRKKQGKDTLRQEGDVTSVDSSVEFFTDNFYVESKAYKYINLWSLMKRKGTLYDWIMNYSELSNNSNKYLFLVAKENNKPIITVTDYDFSYFGLDNQCYLKFYTRVDKVRFFIFNFADILGYVDVDLFKQSLLNTKIMDRLFGENRI